MTRKTFTMKIFDGMAAEYKKRHNELWPEMRAMIKEHGGSNYTISLDEESGILYGYIELEDEQLWAKSAETDICKKWWAYMADIMYTNPDNSPISKNLNMVFHLD